MDWPVTIEGDLSVRLIEWPIWVIGNPTKVLTPYWVRVIVSPPIQRIDKQR
jgi:hypothetical protein